MCILYNATTGEFANIALSNNNKVTVVSEFDMATDVADDIACKVLSKCTKKLKGFKKIQSEKIVSNVQTNKESQCSDIDTEKIPEKTNRKNFSQEERIQVYVRDRGLCGICGEFIAPDKFTLDHIVPLARGGSNSLDNIQCCCKKCNIAKADSMPDEYFENLLKILDFQMEKGNKAVKSGFRRIERKYNKTKKKTS